MSPKTPPALPRYQKFTVAQLGIVEITATDPWCPELRIWLDTDYRGEITSQAQAPNGNRHRLYLACTSRQCVEERDTKAQLDKFVEVLHHHDVERDGIYDADAVIDAIELAMWESQEAPVVFERPRGGPYTWLLMKLLAVAPPPPRHIAYSFGELRQRFRKVDYLWAVPLLAVFLALVQLQVHLVPWTQYSVVTGYFAVTERIGLSSMASLIIFGALLGVWMRRGKHRPGRTQTPHTYGVFNRAALYEEQVWREGAHRWNLGQRLVSCVTFGAIHMVNLIYPVATILPLSVAGGVFMFIYLRAYWKYRGEGRIHARRDATLRAALAHRLYNRCALALILFVVVSLVVGGGLSLVGLIALVGSALALIWSDRHPPEH